ncbi:fucolectin-1-like [Heterodontus francisci]|uniref:fucolectin-1-like n=1 Tax=Heterodontus francisci TaxID=7792 RepID=UPI00355BD390
MFLRVCVVILMVSGLGKAHVDPDLNLVLQGRASQSSLDSYLGNAINAIDGNSNSDCSLGSCSITTSEQEPWWRVDLLQSFRVATVSITNRMDCCTGNLNGAEIRIGDSLDNNGKSNARCGVVESIGPGETQHFSCNGMFGRYVTVVIPGRQDSLALAEVAVYGNEHHHH